ncbi:MAG TPA: cyclic nucleotide-binding domain-containing protein, partial [Solirubrobacterales bacterium]|nr:cyclic nucleotide-binding domain-containing protein [Solirubrobacterales bacterium]
VEVEVDGSLVCRQGLGDFFGEIALLHDVPRTATITAVAPVTVLAIKREPFLTAIGAHVRSATAAETVARDRLDQNRSNNEDERLSDLTSARSRPTAGR